MAVFEHFPYTNFHEMNMDYLLKTVKELSDQVQEFEDLLATGPVVDVKTMVNGASTSIKNGSGIANLPAASDTTDGVIGLDAVTDDILRISGAGTYDVPILTGGKIDGSQIDAVKDLVTFDSNVGDWVSCVDSNGIATMPAATATKAGGVMYVPADNSGNIYAEVLSGEATDKLAFVNSGGNIDSSLIPPTGVTAGTYGTSPNYADASYYAIYGAQVASDGRITEIHQNPVPFMRTDIATIAAGSYTQSIYFDTTTNYPWYNNACFANVNVFQQMTNSKGATYLQALIPGTDYTWNLYPGYLNVTLTNSKTTPVYVCVNGSYGRRAM